MKSWHFLASMAIFVVIAAVARADAIDSHPAGAQLAKIFAAPVPADFKSTGIARADYLKLMAGNIDFFKKYQNDAGAIIDPVSNGERQYSTPAFALAAGLLVKESGRKDLLDPATRAMSCALTALIEKRTADKHSDFYIPLLVHAYRILKDLVPPGQASTWAEQFRLIDPETMYRVDLRGMNWNIVSCSGELLRRKDGLVAPQRLEAQMNYLERCLNGHMKTLTPLGLFEDPNAPLAYDAFSRLWLSDAFADDAYAAGAHEKEIQAFLQTGALSGLLLLSPSGEWASGGRSALHNWTDLQNVVICEVSAAHWKSQKRDDVASAFKRAAHLAFQSAARWQRPTGELWIVKNRAEPEVRLAFESYSNHSQYNLLPMAMLAMAYTRADESIAERPSPSEVGGYVFDARQTFHKIAAAAGGYYVLIDTAADPHYNATGLQRVHRAGVLFPTFSDTVAGDRAYGPGDAPKVAIAPGIQWKTSDSDSQWISLADFSNTESRSKRTITSTDLKLLEAQANRVVFDVAYSISSEGMEPRVVTEHYAIDSTGVELTSTVTGQATSYRAQLPILVSEGASDTEVKLTPNAAAILSHGSATTFELPPDGVAAALQLEPTRLINHNGHVRQAVAGLRSNQIKLRISLSQQ